MSGSLENISDRDMLIEAEHDRARIKRYGYYGPCHRLLRQVYYNKEQKAQANAVDIKVKMCCDGCERRVKRSVSGLKGVKSVEVNRKQSRVTVKGQIEPKKILEGVLETGKKAEFWPYVPYNFVSYPYAAQAYDKKAPSGYVKNVPQAFASSDATEEQYTSLFSDENPNACSIM
ncbi:Heavy metal-associated isoprenylated plant protein 20-like protein [Drosera capensis]